MRHVMSRISEKKFRFKGIMSLTAVALTLCCALSGCGKSESYNEVSKAISEVSTLKSGRITVLSQVEPSASRVGQSVKSDLLFKEKDGTYQYCHVQYDKNDKPVFCEFSDGDKTQQWLIGKGWGGSASGFTKESPHRYITLVSTPPNEAAVETIVCEEQPTGKQYTITLNSAQLNKTVYEGKEMAVISEKISLLLDESGMLISYIDTAEIEDTVSKQSRKYRLQITLSDQNSITEVTRPELRDYTFAANADIEQK